MTVITISRQYGSGGDETADLIRKETGYHLFDKHILIKAALDVGLSEQEVFDYSEDSYKVRSFLDRLFGRSAPVAQMHVWKEEPDGVRKVELRDLDETQALTLVRRAIEEAYHMGNILILGRGGQVILRDYPGVLHVRIEAPLEDRIRRVRQRMASTERPFSSSLEARRVAQDLIAANDLASADYLKRLYAVDWSDPLLYDLIVNTHRLPAQAAARAIITVAQQIEAVPQMA